MLAEQNNTLYCSMYVCVYIYIFFFFVAWNSIEYEILVIREEIVVRHMTVCCSSDHCCTICSLKVCFSSLIVPAITETRSAALVGNVQHFEILNIKSKINFISDTVRFKLLNKSCIIKMCVHMCICVCVCVCACAHVCACTCACACKISIREYSYFQYH
jgi:hypothetical protein